MKTATSILTGLVMAGGYSKRMGTDKALLKINDERVYQRAVKLLAKFCELVYVSCRKEQGLPHLEYSNFVYDQYNNAGPLGAFLTAFESIPGAAFLTVAMDMPLLTSNDIDHLLKNRDSNANNTCFIDQHKMRQPFAAIWEPSAYPYLKEAHTRGQLSLLRVMDKMDVHEIKAPDDRNLLNMNYPGDLDFIKTSFK